MAGRLSKYVSVTKFKGHPAVAGAPARTIRFRSGRRLVGYKMVRSYYIGTGQLFPGVGFTGVHAGSSHLVRRAVYEDVYSTLTYPAVAPIPAVPDAIITQGAAGWDGGARSVESFAGDVEFAFDLPLNPVGVICGLSDGAPVRTYDHVSFGFIVQRGNPVSIIEGGWVIATLPGISLAGVPRFSVRRVNQGVDYLVDGVLVYRSEKKDDRVLYAEATLYSPSDYVDNPLLTEPLYGEAGGLVPVPIGTISDRPVNGAGGLVPVAYLSSRLRGMVSAGGRIPPPVAEIHDRTYGYVGGLVPAPSLLDVALGAPAIAVSFGGGSVPLPTSSARVLVGAVASVPGSVPVLRMMAADRAYGSCSGEIPPPRISGGWEYLGLPNNIFDADMLTAADWAFADAPLLLLALDGLGVGATAELSLVAEDALYEFMSLGSYTSLTGMMQAVASESLRIDSDIASARNTGIQYAVNVATGALSEYRDFGFTQFARAGADLWGCRPDGLYRLTQDVLTDALVDFGVEDGGSTQFKRASAAYIGIRTDGEVYLRVTTSEGTQVYRAASEGEVRRVELAKGVSARSWGLELELVDATFATIHSLEVQIGVSQRRTGGRR